MKNLVNLILLLIVFILTSCDKEPLKITAIDPELNESFLTGNNLNLDFFSTQNVLQYYEVERYAQLDAKLLQGQLDQFILDNYRANFNKLKELKVLFYQKRLFSTYRNQLYEKARASENGTLEGENKNLIALISYVRLTTKPHYFVRHSYLYVTQPTSTKTDTLSLTTLTNKK